MPVITISREFASGGNAIARQTASALDYRLAEKATIERVLLEYGFVQFSETYDTAPGFWDRFDERRLKLVTMLNRVVEALARQGDIIIVGRGSFAVLGGLADVLNVRIKAPLPWRVARAMAEHQFASYEVAEQTVTENDRLRKAFLRSYYGTDGNDAAAFDLVIDTGKVAPEPIVSLLVETAQGLAERKTGYTRSTVDLDVDSVLAGAVLKILTQPAL